MREKIGLMQYRKSYEKRILLFLKCIFTVSDFFDVYYMLQDVPPDGRADPELSSELSITIKPDIAASTPASPLFSEPIYILDIREVRFPKTRRFTEINLETG
jgi:hypothetical protein